MTFYFKMWTKWQLLIEPSLNILADDFESKFQFHPVVDFPPPGEFKPFPRSYPSKENRGSSTEHSRFLSSTHDRSSVCSIDFLFPL